MKAFISELRPAILATVVLGAVTCGAYPLLITGIAQTVFKDKASGSLITDKDGKVIGSALLGQNFAADQYFHPRPSAAGAGYDAASSSGSNLGPTSQKLNDSIKERIAAQKNPDSDAAWARSDRSQGRQQNPGSIAASDSGQFHAYRKNRRHEMDRIESFEKAKLVEVEDAQFARELEAKKAVESAKTAKRRARV